MNESIWMEWLKRTRRFAWDDRTPVSRAALAGLAILVVAIVVASVQWPNPLTAAGTLLAAVAAVVFGIGGHEVRAIFFRPVLDVTLDLQPPDALLIQTEVRQPKTLRLLGYVPTYYYRLRVANNGNASARDVEVRLLHLRKQDPKLASSRLIQASCHST
jgi:hypothetical protein